ncbi:HAD superfamily hydrolase, probable phosphatase [Arcobacter venerupis]|uniref:phosphoglycolate phosphatase n=1 Tax=Arcobacter venerupis TaxID=1054033 RepID=A0AAE7B5R2_9BACT|nr:HAD family hydrolase [Arcobacter venerupis]QKF65818.1 HAD superfamily hydrolase, probable phosphatase [Arcobacter venerupis]RWS50324.1 hydrolase [Arcobacter venerupis]
MNKNKIILFDLDGTLIDSTDAIVSTFKHSFKELNFDFTGDDENIKSLIGYPLDIMYKELGVDESKVWDFVDAYKNRYRIISREQTLLLENAYEAVYQASLFARVSVVTTKTRMYTMPLLEHFNIEQFFEIVTGRENVQNPKPHPEPILITLEQMNYDEKKDSVWMIGDTKLDLIAANDANVNSIGLLCGYGTEDELLKYTNIVKPDALSAITYIKSL